MSFELCAPKHALTGSLFKSLRITDTLVVSTKLIIWDNDAGLMPSVVPFDRELKVEGRVFFFQEKEEKHSVVNYFSFD